MQNFNQTQVTDWINNAAPTELVTVAKQALLKIGNLPPDQRDQFTREINTDPALTKLFTASA